MVNELIFSNEIKELQNQVSKDVNARLKKKPRAKWYALGSVGIALIAGATLFYPKDIDSKIEKQNSDQFVVSQKRKVALSENETEDVIPNEKNNSLEKKSVLKEHKTNTPIFAETEKLSVSLEKSSDYVENHEKILPEETIELQNNTIQEESISNSSTTSNEPSTVEPILDTDSCKETMVSVKVNVKNSAYEMSNGEISIKRDDKTEDILYFRLIEDSDLFEENTTFTDLEAGIYHLQMKDKNGCLLTKTEAINVKTISCNEKTDYLFNTVYDNSVAIKTGTPSLKISVKNKAGVSIWESDNYEESEYHWNGMSFNGTNVENGLYIYEIETESKTKCMGSITVLNR